MRILIVDDDVDMRRLLLHTLQSWGYDVVQAIDGAQAWDLLQNEPFSFVITDWIMPNLDGLELCRRIRGARFTRYIYIILLTAKHSKEELIKGMEAGADDFLIKPFNAGELKVRIRAGERIIKLESNLEEQHKKLQEAYFRIREDLDAAVTMQRSLLPSRALVVPGFRFEWIFTPCHFVAGDIFNVFQFNEHRTGFYILDVAGHGIPAAMLSVTLSTLLSPTASQGSPLMRFIPDPPHYDIAMPAEAIHTLNQLFQSKDDVMQYFTMIYGIVETRDAKLLLTQAGHPSPIYQPKEAKADLLGTGGFPVGMLPDVTYQEEELYLHPGDRLFFYSDGIPECIGKDGERFSVPRLMGLVDEWRDRPLQDAMAGIKQAIERWRGSDEFEDDITLLALERETM
ncbi:MAG: fused response regulator/phosphatase [Candidatus Methylomirabilis oxygeniifera]|uniref:Response regulator receiver protein n=1 Tax=Methylomirabilis oxygeniifera TaxID=671143 RepID=D5MLE6_METO1|nr:MAG: fused response regulator/phosphatase [Candidatus Methylomirabilis oxyfera]CBE67812.1 Response regulator receiver protein [Candidatus Methylomirabilis oxyfera]